MYIILNPYKSLVSCGHSCIWCTKKKWRQREMKHLLKLRRHNNESSDK